VIAALGAARGYGPGALVCRFRDARITESSGLAASARSDAWFFTHNDSGDGPVVYAVDRMGETLADWRLEGASALDWEDMAQAPGEGKQPALYLGDIGDNLEFRPLISIYRIREPQPDPAHPGTHGIAKAVTRFDLFYEDGPHNAEALLVHPRSGQIFVVTKSGRPCGIYATDGPPRAAEPNRLRKVASLDLAALSSAPAAAAAEGLLVTGGDISPDAARVVLRTYLAAYEWPVVNGNVAAAFRGRPAAIALPETPGGEAIAYSRDGRSLLVSSEGKQSPVYELTPQQ
jgi:hypothetical protein